MAYNILIVDDSAIVRAMVKKTLAIAGVFPLAGFFSKDEILWKSFSSGSGNMIFWLIGAITAGPEDLGDAPPFHRIRSRLFERALVRDEVIRRHDQHHRSGTVQCCQAVRCQRDGGCRIAAAGL